MSLDHCPNETAVNAKVAVHVKVQNSTTFLKKNGERRDSCISTTSHSIPKLAKQKSRVK